jgi:cathepsin L
MLAALFAICCCQLVGEQDEKDFVAYLREQELSFTGNEYHFRLGLFLSVARYVRDHNAGNSGFKVSLNHLAILTPAEYSAIKGYRSVGEEVQVSEVPLRKQGVGADPASVDWRTSGKVQEIKDQAKCGSCWAFASTAAQESAWAIKNGELVSLSEQNLVDCVTTSYGCSGGNVNLAYAYVKSKQAGFFARNSDYPYTAKDGTCKYKTTYALTSLTGYATVTKNSEAALQTVVATNGPVAVAIDASHNSFQLYAGGVYKESLCSSRTLDHAVTVVGYGTSTEDYWLVKNSWGTKWGETGYIKMQRNKNNACGIATEAYIPLV